MQGTDKDLAAHLMIIYHRGKCLYGIGIKDVFGEVSQSIYFDSIMNDIENAEEDIAENPTYIILNLCRVLANKENGLILSKVEGGNWGINHIPSKYHHLILCALENYSFGRPIEWNEHDAQEYARYMIGEIRRG